ncbi:MAG: DUF3108 domain-containing protein [Sulfuriferula sp.]
MRRIFLLALVISVLAHLLLLATPDFLPSAAEHPETMIQARLQPLPLPKPVVKPKPVPAPVIKTIRKPRPKPKLRTQPAPPKPVPIPEPPTPPMPGTNATPASTQAVPTAPAEPPTDTAAASEPAPLPSALLNALPGKIDINYTLYWGANGFKVGRAAYIWQVQGDHYVLTSITEGTGLIGLIQPGRLVQISEGHITPQGLAPDNFWIQRGKTTPGKTSVAHFNYQQHTVTLGKINHTSTVPLLPGAQDILSVTFQLAMLAPFQDEQLLHVTSSKDLTPYTVQVVGDEMLDTSVGQLRTLHVVRNQEAGEDAIDVWLAQDYNYLPAKIQINHGKFGIVEQVINGIKVEH